MNLGNNGLTSFTTHGPYFQNGNISDNIKMPSSSPVSMHLVLHLLFEGGSKRDLDETRIGEDSKLARTKSSDSHKK